MLKKTLIILFVVIVLAFSMTAWGEKKIKDSLKAGAPAPLFTLKDAYDKEYNLKAILDKEEVKAVVLMIGNRKVRGEANKWAIELDKLYGKDKRVVLIMIADLRGLPFFVTEKMVKWGVKRENLPTPILLDWKGKVNQKYKTQKDKNNLYIIDGDGKISHTLASKCSDESMEKMKAKIQNLLEDNEQ